MQIKDTTIVITGAGRGIGRALAMRFAAQGANIALVDRSPTEVYATAQACTHDGVHAAAYLANVASETEVSEVFKKIVSDFGAVNVLINNAGIVSDGLLLKARDGKVISKMTLAQWQTVIDINLTGVFLCAREAAEKMIELGTGGVVINISSISRSGNVGQTNYSAAKAGVVSMGVVWARELARFGIRVGSIAPGYTQTDILTSMAPEVLEKVIAPVPLRRLGHAEEVAHAAQFIIENDFFTGRCLDLDGGLRI